MACSNWILIVDDDPDLRGTMKDLLEMEGFPAAAAENGEEALKLLQEKQQPCLILLDLMMPVMDGWEFLETLKHHYHALFASTPILVISAVADLGGLEQRYNCQVMIKPADIQQLVMVARQYC